MECGHNVGTPFRAHIYVVVPPFGVRVRLRFLVFTTPGTWPGSSFRLIFKTVDVSIAVGLTTLHRSALVRTFCIQTARWLTNSNKLLQPPPSGRVCMLVSALVSCSFRKAEGVCLSSSALVWQPSVEQRQASAAVSDAPQDGVGSDGPCAHSLCRTGPASIDTGACEGSRLCYMTDRKLTAVPPSNYWLSPPAPKYQSQVNVCSESVEKVQTGRLNAHFCLFISCDSNPLQYKPAYRYFHG